MSEDIVNNDMNLYTIINLISDFGGLYLTFVLAFFNIIGSNINNNLNMSKLIRGVLYAKKENLKVDNKDIDDERQAII